MSSQLDKPEGMRCDGCGEPATNPFPQRGCPKCGGTSWSGTILLGGSAKAPSSQLRANSTPAPLALIEKAIEDRINEYLRGDRAANTEGGMQAAVGALDGLVGLIRKRYAESATTPAATERTDPEHIAAICGPDHLVKIDDGQSVHVRTAGEWLELARRDLSAKASSAMTRNQSYWLIERGSPAEWWAGTDRPNPWTSNVEEVHPLLRFPTSAQAHAEAERIRYWPGFGGSEYRVTEHMDCPSPSVPPTSAFKDWLAKQPYFDFDSTAGPHRYYDQGGMEAAWSAGVRSATERKEKT